MVVHVAIPDLCIGASRGNELMPLLMTNTQVYRWGHWLNIILSAPATLLYYPLRSKVQRDYLIQSCSVSNGQVVEGALELWVHMYEATLQVEGAL